MIKGYAIHGCNNEGHDPFDLMKFLVTNPNYITFVWISLACSSMGLMDKAMMEVAIKAWSNPKIGKEYLHMSSINAYYDVTLENIFDWKV